MMVSLHSFKVLFSFSGEAAKRCSSGWLRLSSRALRLMPSLPPFLMREVLVVIEELRPMSSSKPEELHEF